MKRIIALLLTVVLCLCLAACGKATEPEQDPQGPHTEAADTEGTEEKQLSGSSAASENPAGKSEEPLQQSIELVGPWHLAEETNAIFDVFPGAMEFGSTMEIRSNGAIAWYIGADGGAGTYSVDGSVLHCELTNAMDNSPMTMDFTAKRQDGQLFLTTVYRDMELCWRWGEGEAGKG